MRISTIIPAYNRADLIGETLRATLSQTRAPDEVIVVDDGSTDGTPDLISEQFGRDVILICQNNSGAGAARNTGLAHSTGDIIHFQDSDDLSTLNTYEEQAAAIEAGADVAYGPWLKTRFDGDILDPHFPILQQGPIQRLERLDVYTLMVAWVTVFQPCMFRRSILEKAGPYRVDLAPSEDMELMYRISRLTRKFTHTPKTLLLYRVHPENQISEMNLSKRILDRGNAWEIFAASAQERNDLSALDRMRFQFRFLEVVREVQEYDSARAESLSVHIPTLIRTLFPAFAFQAKVQAKWRVLRGGHGYSRVFNAGIITGAQRNEIERLGYRLRQS